LSISGIRSIPRSGGACRLLAVALFSGALLASFVTPFAYAALGWQPLTPAGAHPLLGPATPPAPGNADGAVGSPVPGAEWAEESRLAVYLRLHRNAEEALALLRLAPHTGFGYTRGSEPPLRSPRSRFVARCDRRTAGVFPAR
jgi:hypothetical protein